MIHSNNSLNISSFCTLSVYYLTVQAPYLHHSPEYLQPTPSTTGGYGYDSHHMPPQGLPGPASRTRYPDRSAPCFVLSGVAQRHPQTCTNFNTLSVCHTHTSGFFAPGLVRCASYYCWVVMSGYKPINSTPGKPSYSPGEETDISSHYSDEQSSSHITISQDNNDHDNDPIDALGLLTEDRNSVHHFKDNGTYNDNRRFSVIQPDQKMLRPIHKNTCPRSKNSNNNPIIHTDTNFSQTSRLLGNSQKYRYRPYTDDTDVLNNSHTSKPIPFPTSLNQSPYSLNRKNTTTQKSLLSQSLPISVMSDTYNDHEIDEVDNSIYASSNPSSRRSSNVSSLNDVCFPVDSLDAIERSKQWPNLAVLEEFAKQEIDNMKRFNSSSIGSKKSSIDLTSSSNDVVNFQYPIVSNIDYGEITEPLMVSTTEEIDKINGRLRPKKRAPWEKPNFITKHERLTKFRFTYFREDLPDTIHSPTISGLLHNGTKFQDIFSPSYYSTTSNNTNNDSTIEEKDQKSNKFGTASTNISQEPSTSDKSYLQPFWLDVLNPTEDEMKVISKTFGIHPLTSEDIFLGEAREKVELFKDYYFICFTSFDVEEEHQRRKQAAKKALNEAAEIEELKYKNDRSFLTKIMDLIRRKRRNSSPSSNSKHSSIRSSNSSICSYCSTNSKKSRKSKAAASLTSKRLKKKRHNKDELIPLTMYIVVFKDGVITFHFQPTPHTGNVRRRARLLRDYLTVSSDWVGYALIDDITDAYAPLIEVIEDEVNSIEDEIITMQSGDHSDSDSDSDSDNDSDNDNDRVWIRVKRRNSNITGDDKNSIYSRSSLSTNSTNSSIDTKIISWKKKEDMLKRIGDCRRRIMSLLRLLGTKADVIKGFSKRYHEQWEVGPRTEIGLYLGDIQDHIVTMVQNLNHYEKLLARSHSNYLAQINIDMTKVNNDMNDILGKITILGTIVLPLNIVTGLWGMNCLVPGQDVDSLDWFWGILAGMLMFAVTCYYYAKDLID